MKMRTILAAKIWTFTLLTLLMACSHPQTEKFAIENGRTVDIAIPEEYAPISSGAVAHFYKQGRENYGAEGLLSPNHQKSIFFFRKGEFNLIRGKFYPIDTTIISNYEASWDKGISTLFRLQEDLVNSKNNAYIDSLSTKEIINGREYLVFEFTVNLKDEIAGWIRLKSVRYSTPVDLYDYVFDVSFINGIDSMELYTALHSIRIK